MADTPQGETVTPVAPSNETGTVATPPVVTSNADVETAKRDAEQARIRANQLENENRKLKEAQDEAQRKQLEEKEEFKTLYETLKTQIDERDAKDRELERQTELKSATENVFKDYPANVVELAKTAGLALVDDSEAAAAALKIKLDAFKAQIGTSAPSVTSNNPSNPSPAAQSRQEMVQRAHPGAESAMALASARGDESVIRKYISDLPAIQRMKEIARNGA